ncbi:MAG: FmdB family transcriptional regulator [Actinomycetota bacterium]|nr:FmdB family transcriptional regulator [Actinomycetota bacterium]
MPVYEYRCRECARTLEVIRAMSADPPTRCPSCAGTLRRVWGRVGVRFDGWGFAATDSLLPEARRRREFSAVKRRAEQLADSD